MKRVVITGIGALTPIGNTYQAFKTALFEGKSGAGPITKFDPELFKTQFACELKDFNAADHMHRREVGRLDPFSHYALVVAEEAVQDSGLDIESLDKDRAGVIWGSGIGGFKTIEADIESAAIRGGAPKYSPFLIPKLIADIAPGHISIKYGLRGINYGCVSACASASHAIINAADYIRLGRSDVFIAGGSEASITKAGIGGFSSMKALSTRNENPELASRPFDAERDGFVLGEGGAALILEEYEFAKRRGAKIYGEIVGVGMTADAHHITAPHPEGLGAQKVMAKALKNAELNPEDIDYINVHGTSTPLGDIAEISAIQKVFGDKAYDLNISSTKSMTGHLLGAAGAAETVAGLAALSDNVIPPTINHFNDDPAIDSKLNLTFNTAQEKTVRCFMSNTFGFGGHNTTIIIRELVR